MCVCVHRYRKLLASFDTEDDGADSDHVVLGPPVKRKQVCQMYTEVKQLKECVL